MITFRRALNRSVLFSLTMLCLVALTFSFLPIEARAGTVPISGLSPNPDGGDPSDPLAVTACNGGPQHGVVYRNSEAEPHIAVNPTDPLNMIAGWHQDRWSTGGGQSLGAAYTKDGGVTWTQVTIPFTRCSGAAAGAAGDFERASDPWISFGADGKAHYMALVFNRSILATNGMASAWSEDGGVTWSDPVLIKHSPARDKLARSLFNDKNTLTADPGNSLMVYATWAVFRNKQIDLLFSRSTDGGLSWGATRPVGSQNMVTPHEHVVFRAAPQIVVLPDGTLVNAFFRGLFNRTTGEYTTDQAVYRSFDQGMHWEKTDTHVNPLYVASALDVELGIPVRDAQQLPDIAVNSSTGDLYITWQDIRFNWEGRVGVVVSRSNDGGSTWSDPIPVNPTVAEPVPTTQAFLPAVAVNADGKVGVLFYDFRNDVDADAVLSTDVYLAVFNADLSLDHEVRLTDISFDLRQMVIAGDRGYFPGDYVGLSAAGSDFVAAFTVANDLGLPVEFPQDNSGLQVDNNNRQDVVFRRVTP